MEQLDQTSTPAYKKCRICLELKPIKDFSPNKSLRDGYRNSCGKCCYITYGKAHHQSAKGKELFRRYWQSSKGKETQRRYRQSAKGREAVRRYKQSVKGILTSYRWRSSPKWKEYLKQYGQKRTISGENKQYEKERNHRIQEEAGCHWKSESFYPGYRIVKAFLEGNCEVVEIKV